MNEDLRRSVEYYRGSFIREGGRSFEHFYCPILRRDEPTELCKGHVIPDAFGNSGIWVPQRADVDNFYGSVVEADFMAAVRDRERDPIELWLDRDASRKHRPKLEIGGEQLEHYFSRDKPPGGSGRIGGHLVAEDGSLLTELVLKIDSEKLAEMDGKLMDIVVDRDYRGAAIASALKAAHLTMFRIFEYEYVFSAAGLFLGDILREFFEANRGKPQSELTTIVGDYFRPFERISSVLQQSGERLESTVTNNEFLCCVGASGPVFAVGVVIRAGTDTLCVFLPAGDGKTINTYFSFMNERPASVMIRTQRFVPATETEGAFWGISGKPPQPVRLMRYSSEP